LHAHKRIGRSEERTFKAERQAKQPERSFEAGVPNPRRRPYN